MLRMYTLCLAGILGLGLAATGCGLGGGRHGSGNFDVAWALVWSGGGSVSCAGAGVTEINLDVQDVYTGEVRHDAFFCSDGYGMSQDLLPDDYTVALRAYDSGRAMVSEWTDAPNTYPIYSDLVTPLPDVLLPI
ncbi:MAG TPA: hypothetical protein VJ860_10855 [Polyangia bacterium]|nr:hypothetical protein [Polyangia bacterium]